MVSELTKQAGWAQQPVAISQYRDRNQREVDVILERGQDIVGIEVKATATPTTAHAKHLVHLRVRLGDRILATPISARWSG